MGITISSQASDETLHLVLETIQAAVKAGLFLANSFGFHVTLADQILEIKNSINEL